MFSGKKEKVSTRLSVTELSLKFRHSAGIKGLKFYGDPKLDGPLAETSKKISYTRKVFDVCFFGANKRPGAFNLEKNF